MKEFVAWGEKTCSEEEEEEINGGGSYCQQRNVVARCQVVVGHDMGEVNAIAVEEERKGWLVKKLGVAAGFFPNFEPWFFLVQNPPYV